jgi:hypothetical protein
VAISRVAICPVASVFKKFSDQKFSREKANGFKIEWREDSGVSTMIGGDKKRKSDEWDSREREWTDELRRQTAGSGNLGRVGGAASPKKRKVKKLNPKKRFRLMLVCLSIFVFSMFILWLTLFNVDATYQATLSMFSSIISGVIFVVNYGKDIAVTIINAYAKSSLR